MMEFHLIHLKEIRQTQLLTVEERMIGGLGIHLVKKLMDEYDYKRHTNKNIITLN